MLQCIFLLSDSGEVMLEKQLTGHRVDRSICDWFWDHAISQGDAFKSQPVIASPTHYLFQVVREGITFLACTQVEMPPLMGIEFLCRVADVLSDYLGGLNEDVIKDNFVIVYEVFVTICYVLFGILRKAIEVACSFKWMHC
ncbi:AP-3 complex subunit mu isoform X1 [Herrania umbratica]|uniref:AP-3 complex subunit mu isoform X1 n=1 Tax=Herrania umbratica TaxID=108875 RepID=A0A6J1A8G3_9ROSI|nr:AP-3 complex subunit mu isoform X1 [Herrania umbratica]